VSLIYVVFVVVFLVAHALVGQRRLTEREALANALDLLEPRLDRPIEGMTEAGSRICSIRRAPFGPGRCIAQYSTSCQGVPTSSPGGSHPRGFARRYEQVAVHPLFSRALTAVVLLYTAAAVVGSVLLVATSMATDRGPRRRPSDSCSRPCSARLSSSVASWPCRRPISPRIAGSCAGPRLAADHAGFHLL